MTQFNRDAAIYNARLDRAEIGFRNRISREKNRYIRAVAERMAAGKTDFDIEKAEHERNIRDLVARQSMAIIPQFGVLKAAQFDRKATLSDPAFYERLINRWLVDHALENAFNIAATTTSDIISVIEAGIINGIGSGQIAANIRKIRELSPFRARTIARTETGMAASYAGSETAKQAANEYDLVIHKFWNHTEDERTRISHREMDASKGIPITDKFDVGGIKMDRPLDPAGGAANVVNCRCVQTERVIDED